jgi:hypothetical protein
MVICPYCKREMPSGIDHPAMWTCCGEQGHGRELTEAEEEEAAEAEAWLQHMQEMTERKQ